MQSLSLHSLPEVFCACCSGHESTVWAVAFNTGGSQMVSCSADTTMRIWNCTSNSDGELKPSLIFPCHGNTQSQSGWILVNAVIQCLLCCWVSVSSDRVFSCSRLQQGHSLSSPVMRDHQYCKFLWTCITCKRKSCAFAQRDMPSRSAREAFPVLD